MNQSFLKDYENMSLIRYDELEDKGIATVKFSELENLDCGGVLKASIQKDGKLEQQYTEHGNHVGVIAATRLGKTTSYVIPTIVSFAKQKVKKSMIISDPKGEIYRLTAQTLKDNGYKVRLINFRDRRHSEGWNPLTPIYRMFIRARNILDEVELVTVDGQPKNRFFGKIYDDQRELEADVEKEHKMMLEDVDNEIDRFCRMVIITVSQKDPIWEDGARDLLKAFLYAMLEDTEAKKNPITEETFSLRTIFEIYSTFKRPGDSDYDNGYFSNRSSKSKAKRLAGPLILDTQRGTCSSYMCTFFNKLSGYQESTTKLITSCNSFEMDELTEGPIAVFISFKDELKSHYETISLFVQCAYKRLIEKANDNPDGRLKVPFYFVLDEFGNFPAMRDFETTISACAGRNIWFILIIQSYAQMSAVYGDKVAAIIRDNLNVHIFFGSNNPDTLEEFSKECGKKTRVSPLSALNGRGSEIEQYELETIRLVPTSRLARFEPGECIITEANCGYVMVSKLERFFLCDELKNLPLSYDKDYIGDVNPLEDKYIYNYVPAKTRSYWDDDD